MSSLVVTFVTMLADILPDLGGLSTGSLGSIITTLTSLIPAITSEIETVVPIVKNIIAGLQGSANITPAQTAALTALDAQCDAAFEAAAAADGVAPDPSA